MLGIIEERPDESDSELASFAGASNVVGTDRLLERIEEDLELLDSRAFLAARLMDVFLGDFDRHEDQWRWSRFGDRREDSWKPIPRDRDQAFVRMDGLLLSLARGFYPQFVKFEGDYGRVLGLAWQARRLDRRLLSDLEWPTWDSVATALQEQITDSVLDAAVERLPDEYGPSDTPVLRRRLASRRDQLRDGARSMYDLSAGEVDIYTTDASEVANVERLPDGDLLVVVTAPETPAGPLEIFRRRFHRTETKEIRLFLRGGADSVRVVGERRGIGVRVVGGRGRDRFVDEAGGAHFYDVGDNSVFVRGRGTSVDHRDFEIPLRTASPFNRDWGRRYSFPPRIRFSPDIGLLFGATVQRHDFGFRKLPWSSVASLTAGWATGADALFVQGRVQVYREKFPDLLAGRRLCVRTGRAAVPRPRQRDHDGPPQGRLQDGYAGVRGRAARGAPVRIGGELGAWAVAQVHGDAPATCLARWGAAAVRHGRFRAGRVRDGAGSRWNRQPPSTFEWSLFEPRWLGLPGGLGRRGPVWPDRGGSDNVLVPCRTTLPDFGSACRGNQDVRDLPVLRRSAHRRRRNGPPRARPTLRGRRDRLRER